jgi:hypothetical protein
MSDDTQKHIVYELKLPDGNYIGVTRKSGTVESSVRERLSKHYYRAHNENLDWLLCRSLRKLPHWHNIPIIIHAIIMGKSQAHNTEVMLRRQFNPSLNSDTRGD